MEKWNEVEIVRFLDYFEARPCLWNPDLPEYRSPDKRSEAIRWIIQKLGFPITEMEIRCKIKNIRSTYLKYLKRVLRAQKVGLKKEYLPTLLWYNKADAFMKEYALRAMNKKEQKKNQQCPRNCGRHESSSSKCDQNLQDSDYEVAAAEFDPEEDNDQGGNPVLTNNGATNNLTDLSSQKNDPMEASDSDEDRFEFRKSNSSTQHSSRKHLHSNRNGFQDGYSNGNHGSRIMDITDSKGRHSSFQDDQEVDEFDTFSRHVGNQLRQLPLERALKCQDAIHSLLMRERIESCQERSRTRTGSNNVSSAGGVGSNHTFGPVSTANDICATGPPRTIPQREPSCAQNHNVFQVDPFSYALKCMED